MDLRGSAGPAAGLIRGLGGLCGLTGLLLLVCRAPASAQPGPGTADYGPAPARLTGAPKDMVGGTGLDDTTELTTRVWRDRVKPGRTRTYKVHVGWGQQLTCAVEFANLPGARPGAYPSFVAVAAYSPDRVPVHDASDGLPERAYDGTPVTVGLGTVPVAWTNRWVDDEDVRPVREAGDYLITVVPAHTRGTPEAARADTRTDRSGA